MDLRCYTWRAGRYRAYIDIDSHRNRQLRRKDPVSHNQQWHHDGLVKELTIPVSVSQER
jgi:hypothetical protein